MVNVFWFVLVVFSVVSVNSIAVNPETSDPSDLATEPTKANKPATDEPVTDEPVTDEPVTDEPATDEPATDKPADESPASAPVWNSDTAVDFILEAMNHVLEILEVNRLPLPGINESFSISLKKKKVSGHFETVGCQIDNLATLYRINSSTVALQNDGSLTISAMLGFRTLGVSVNYYRFQLWKAVLKGKMSFRIARNSVSFVVVMKLSTKGKFSLKLNTLKLVELSDFKINITGLGIFTNTVMGKILSWIANAFQREIHGNVESTLITSLKSAIESEGFLDSYVLHK